MVWFIFLRWQQHSIERAMDLTNSFRWEELPTREADTGHLTAAGWIPLTMKYSTRVAIAALCFHIAQSTIRIVKNHETMLIAWYPFDWTVSPYYELVNISQVTISVNNGDKILIQPLLCFLNSTVCHNQYISFFLFLRLFFLSSLFSTMLSDSQIM